MDPRLLAKTDLNLLKALQVLFEERNVTRAAERLFITQPAMSKTLQRLRILFEDELFTRSGKGLVTTPRADEIALQLPDILASIEGLISQAAFDPSAFEGEIKIMVAAFMAYQYIPKLVNQLQKLSPKMTLCVTSSPIHSVRKDLEAGDLDFALSFASSEPPTIISTSLGSVVPTLWMRKGHPLAGCDKFLLKDILKYPFVQYHMMHLGGVTKMAETRFDKVIAQRGFSRERLLVTNQFLTAAETLLCTDCLMLGAMSDSVSRGAYAEDLVEKPYPVDLQYDTAIPVVMQQHIRTESSAVHQWLKDLFFDLLRETQQQREGAS